MVDEKKWGIVYCPKNGFFGEYRKRREHVERCLKAHEIDYDMVQSENTRSVDRLIGMFINNGYKTIIIFGGDSALNDAVNCLMQQDVTIRENIVFGLIPNGVMNDFAHFWGFREDDIDQTIEWLQKRRIRKIDLGHISYKNRKGERCHRYFLNCINIGLIATIMNLRRRTRHILGSRSLSFIFSFILLIFQRMDYRMHIKINTDTIKRKITTVCIGNALGYGQTPNAVPYNGLLDVSVVYHPEMTQLFEGIYLFLKGKFLNYKSVHPYRTQEMEIHVEPHTMVGIDGRLMANTPVGPFIITVEKEVLNFIIPD
ncbi:UNVERIFIED_CONTAM: lipid kinase [Prevotella sp. 15_C9]